MKNEKEQKSIQDMTSKELADKLKETQNEFEEEIAAFYPSTVHSEAVKTDIKYRARIDGMTHELQSRDNKEMMEISKSYTKEKYGKNKSYPLQILTFQTHIVADICGGSF